MSNNSQRVKLVSTIAVAFFSFAIPLLYALGYYYDLGHFSAFGFNNDFFPRTVHGYLIQSFYVFVQALIYIPTVVNSYFYTPLYCSIIFIVLVLLRAIFLFLKGKNRNKPFVEGSFLFHLEISTVKVGVWLQSALLLFFLCCLIILLPLSSYQIANSNAKDLISSFSGCDAAPLSDGDQCVFILKDNNEYLSGTLIAKSPNSIALWDGDKTIIYSLQNETINIRFGRNIIDNKNP